MAGSRKLWQISLKQKTARKDPRGFVKAIVVPPEISSGNALA